LRKGRKRGERPGWGVSSTFPNSPFVVLIRLTLLSFVLGYAWAAGWLADAGAVEVSVGHCLLGGGTVGISAARGVWMLS